MTQAFPGPNAGQHNQSLMLANGSARYEKPNTQLLQGKANHAYAAKTFKNSLNGLATQRHAYDTPINSVPTNNSSHYTRQDRPFDRSAMSARNRDPVARDPAVQSFKMSAQNQPSYLDQQAATNGGLPDWSEPHVQNSWGESYPAAAADPRSQAPQWSSQSPDCNWQEANLSEQSYHTQFPELGKSQVNHTTPNCYGPPRNQAHEAQSWGNKFSDQTESDQSKGGTTPSWSPYAPCGQEPSPSTTVDRGTPTQRYEQRRLPNDSIRGQRRGRGRGRGGPRGSSFRGRGQPLGSGVGNGADTSRTNEHRPSDAAHLQTSAGAAGRITVSVDSTKENRQPQTQQNRVSLNANATSNDKSKITNGNASNTAGAKQDDKISPQQHQPGQENERQSKVEGKQHSDQAPGIKDAIADLVKNASSRPPPAETTEDAQKPVPPSSTVNANQHQIDVHAQNTTQHDTWDIEPQPKVDQDGWNDQAPPPPNLDDWGASPHLPYEKTHSNVPSNQADGGWGNNRFLDADGNQGHQLQDWSGGWAPPPIDWEGRIPFSDQELHENVHKWHSVGSAIVALPGGSLDSEKESDKQTITHEIAPRSWVPEDIDGMPIDEWWNARPHDNPPELPLSQEPFWRHYEFPEYDLLQPLSVLEARIDPADNDLEQAQGQTSQTSSNAHMAKLQRMRKGRKAKNEALYRNHQEALVPVRNEWSPDGNIYLRPAEAKDVRQITEIYNFYIKNTIFCPEGEPLNTEFVQERIEDATDHKLPFLVAVDRSSKGNRKNNKRFGDRANTQGEHVIGFSYADDFNDMRGMYRYTVEMDTFVQPARLRQGVGRTLIDKMMSIMDPKYESRGGYDFVSEDPSYGIGGQRTVGNIVVNIPYASADNARPRWIQDWLKQWDFEKSGEMPEIGRKCNTIVSLAMLMRRTGSMIEVNAP